MDRLQAACRKAPWLLLRESTQTVCSDLPRLGVSGKPAMRSSTETGAMSGFTLASGGTITVCSRAYWPERTLWASTSV
mgnify:CR=1 FL=1